MDAANLYEEDIYAWAEQQAAALRRLAGLGGLPNELDLEHVTEEIADLGLSELNGARSYIRNILRHLILSTVDGQAAASRHWADEVIAWQADLQDRLTPAMHRRINMDEIWDHAVRIAMAKLAVYHDDQADPVILAAARWRGTPCPFTLDEMRAADFAIPPLRARLCQSPAS